MNKTNRIYDINLRSFNSTDAVKTYLDELLLQKPEEVILDQIKNEVSGKKILDIGIGGGRTTKYLTRISSDYTGIDYSEAMVSECRKRYPELNIFCCDVRHMEVFGSDEFDFVLFSYNGIDYVSHEDRLQILGEIARVTKKGGYFVFSAHNKESTAYKIFSSSLAAIINNPFQPGKFSLSKNVKAIIHYFQGIRNHMRNKSHEIYGDDYSIINDKEQNYSVMTYYITRTKQIQQLKRAGFSGQVQAFDRYGREVTGNCKHTWIYYLARK